MATQTGCSSDSLWSSSVVVVDSSLNSLLSCLFSSLYQICHKHNSSPQCSSHGLITQRDISQCTIRPGEENLPASKGGNKSFSSQQRGMAGGVGGQKGESWRVEMEGGGERRPSEYRSGKRLSKWTIGPQSAENWMCFQPQGWTQILRS